MADWYAFRIRASSTTRRLHLARAKQRDTAEANFDFVENRWPGGNLPDVGAQHRARAALLPLRHVAWGSNMNNASVCAYSYGTGFSQPHIYQAMDQLGIAQYITRVGLLLGDVESLTKPSARMDDDAWQGPAPLRRGPFVVKTRWSSSWRRTSPLDGLLYPWYTKPSSTTCCRPGRHAGGDAHPVHDRLVRRDQRVGRRHGEDRRRVAREQGHDDALAGSQWRDRRAPAAGRASPSAIAPDEVLGEVVQQFNARMAKAGVAL